MININYIYDLFVYRESHCNGVEKLADKTMDVSALLAQNYGQNIFKVTLKFTLVHVNRCITSAIDEVDITKKTHNCGISFGEFDPVFISSYFYVT